MCERDTDEPLVWDTREMDAERVAKKAQRLREFEERVRSEVNAIDKRACFEGLKREYRKFGHEQSALECIRRFPSRLEGAVISQQRRDKYAKQGIVVSFEKSSYPDVARVEVTSDYFS